MQPADGGLLHRREDLDDPVERGRRHVHRQEHLVARLDHAEEESRDLLDLAALLRVIEGFAVREEGGVRLHDLPDDLEPVLLERAPGLGEVDDDVHQVGDLRFGCPVGGKEGDRDPEVREESLRDPWVLGRHPAPRADGGDIFYRLVAVDRDHDLDVPVAGLAVGEVCDLHDVGAALLHPVEPRYPEVEVTHLDVERDLLRAEDLHLPDP
ncbi:hypothetical protein DSECCO2_647400 [anaerobic digester metagenome]